VGAQRGVERGAVGVQRCVCVIKPANILVRLCRALGL